MTQTTTLIKEELIPPYGGELKCLVVDSAETVELLKYAESLPSVYLSSRAVCDLELLATGAFSPLDRFMTDADYTRVLEERRLSSGHLFPIPITLPVGIDVKCGREVTLCDSKNDPLALMNVDEIFEWNRAEYVRKTRPAKRLRVWSIRFTIGGNGGV